jgi:glycosyltransferase involved in cell wall biosynthesis
MQNDFFFNPLVSIIIPVFNGANYVREAIDSALCQTYGNIEVIVVDDGSNDNLATKSICLSYGLKVKYIEKKNGGVSSALNCGIRAMSGEYFSWLSHDDVYYPNKIQKQVEVLCKTKNRDVIIFTNYVYIDSNSKLLKKTAVNELGNNNPIYSIIMGNLNGCSLLIPVKCFHKVGLFDEELRTIQDYALFAKFAENFKFVHIPDFLVKSRIHGMQQGTQNRVLHLAAADNFFFELLKRYEEIELKGLPASEPLVYLWFSFRFLRNNYIRSALKSKQIACHKILTEPIIPKFKLLIIYFYYFYMKIYLWRFAYFIYSKIKGL